METQNGKNGKLKMENSKFKNGLLKMENSEFKNGNSKWKLKMETAFPNHVKTIETHKTRPPILKKEPFFVPVSVRPRALRAEQKKKKKDQRES